MLTTITLFAALFLTVSMAVYGIQQTSRTQAAWALLTAILFCLLSLGLTIVAIGQIGLLFAAMFVLIPIMRVGMEQNERPGAGTPPGGGESVFHTLATRVDRFVQRQPRGSFVRRMAEMKVHDLPLCGAFGEQEPELDPLEAILAQPAEGKVLREVKSAILQAHHHPGLMWFYRICGLLLLCLSIYKAVYVMGGWDVKARYDRDLRRVGSHDLVYHWVAGRYLAETLAARFPGTSALLVHEPAAEGSPEMRTTLRKAMEEGFGGNVWLKAEDIVPGPSEIGPAFEPASVGEAEEALPAPLAAVLGADEDKAADEATFSALALDRLVEKHRGCNLIIAACGLPADAHIMDLWRMPDEQRPQVVVMNTDVRKLGEAINKGLVAAAVAQNPDVDDDAAPSRDDYKALFKKHFILVDASNILRLSLEYPELVGPKRR